MFVDTQEQLYHGHLVTGHPCAFQDSQYTHLVAFYIGKYRRIYLYWCVSQSLVDARIRILTCDVNQNNYAIPTSGCVQCRFTCQALSWYIFVHGSE